MKSELNFVDFIVPRFLFEKGHYEKSDNPIKIKPKAIISRSKNQFHINMDIELIDSENGFKLKMFCIGIFHFETENDEHLLSFLSLNGPAIVFPYVRSFISSVTALSGFDTITLPTMNLSGFKDELIKELVDIDNQTES